jgi:hypothetical protein
VSSRNEWTGGADTPVLSFLPLLFFCARRLHLSFFFLREHSSHAANLSIFSTAQQFANSKRGNSNRAERATAQARMSKRQLS